MLKKIPPPFLNRLENPITRRKRCLFFPIFLPIWSHITQYWQHGNNHVRKTLSFKRNISYFQNITNHHCNTSCEFIFVTFKFKKPNNINGRRCSEWIGKNTSILFPGIKSMVSSREHLRKFYLAMISSISDHINNCTGNIYKYFNRTHNQMIFLNYVIV